MSLDKSIQHGKDHRKGYRERGLFGAGDVACRPHGACGYCQCNRLIRNRRLEAIARFERQQTSSS